MSKGKIMRWNDRYSGTNGQKKVRESNKIRMMSSHMACVGSLLLALS